MQAFFLFACFVSYIFSQNIKHCTGKCQEYDSNAIMMRKTGHNPMYYYYYSVLSHSQSRHEKMKFWKKCASEKLCPLASAQNLGFTACKNGMADAYPCSNADILSFINLASLGANGDGNDVCQFHLAIILIFRYGDGLMNLMAVSMPFLQYLMVPLSLTLRTLRTLRSLDFCQPTLWGQCGEMLKCTRTTLLL